MNYIPKCQKVTTLSLPYHPFKRLLQTTELANKPNVILTVSRKENIVNRMKDTDNRRRKAMLEVIGSISKEKKISNSGYRNPYTGLILLSIFL